jgi:L-lactate dehydrogenase complex protein LldG
VGPYPGDDDVTGGPDSPARAEVLRRLRAALGPAPAVPEVPRRYRRHGDLPPGDPALLDLFAERLADYRAGVRRTTAEGVAAAVAAALGSTAGPVVVPAGLDPGWLAEVDAGAVTDDGVLSARDLDGYAAVVTAVAVAVAETGTLVLDGGPDQGRRALTLVPDLHVCVVRADQVVQTVAEALARLDPLCPLTWVSGPSATSDIELDRVEGVHGPRTLEVVLVHPTPAGG